MQGCRCADSEKPKFKIQTLKLKKKFSGHATTEFCHNDATGARLFRLNSFNFVLRSLIFSSFVLSFRAKTKFIILNCWIHRTRRIRQSSRYLFLTAHFFYSEPEVSYYDCVFFGRKPRNLHEFIGISSVNLESITYSGLIHGQSKLWVSSKSAGPNAVIHGQFKLSVSSKSECGNICLFICSHGIMHN